MCFFSFLTQQTLYFSAFRFRVNLCPSHAAGLKQLDQLLAVWVNEVCRLFSTFIFCLCARSLWQQVPGQDGEENKVIPGACLHGKDHKWIDNFSPSICHGSMFPCRQETLTGLQIEPKCSGTRCCTCSTLLFLDSRHCRPCEAASSHPRPSDEHLRRILQVTSPPPGFQSTQLHAVLPCLHRR